MRFELKIAVSLLLTGEKSKATFDSRLRLSIEEAGGAFKNRLQVGFFMMKISFPRLIARLKSKSTSLIVFENQFQNQFSWVNLLGAGVRERSETEVKRQSKGDFAAGFLKNNTVLVINCFGNIHTSKIIFHFNCVIMVSGRAGKSFLFWKLQGKMNSKS